MNDRTVRLLFRGFLAICAVALLVLLSYGAYNVYNSAGLSVKEAEATVLDKHTHVSPGKTETPLIGGKPHSVVYPPTTKYHLNLVVEGHDVHADVSKDMYDTLEVGTVVGVRYVIGRASGKPEVQEVIPQK